MQLVIAEKPSVAGSIAQVIGAKERKDGYLQGGGYIVSWCLGHLIELAAPEQYDEKWKHWNYDSLPVQPEKWQYIVKEERKEQYDILYKLLHDERVTSVVCATDAGREGELIFRLVYEKAKCTKPIKRLWISSMEEEAIQKGFENLKDGSEYENLYHSALCRQWADWLVGINFTRLFTTLYKDSVKDSKILKVGRVQTPTLAMLVERENKIQAFAKDKYFKVHLLCGGVDAVSQRIDDKEKAVSIVNACMGKNAVVTEITKEIKNVAPPKLYDLTTLQREANRLFGFTAKQTLDYTQSLYEKKLVTYPRTDSQYLSDDMKDTAENVIQAIFETFSSVLPNKMFCPATQVILNGKKVTDHHAIIPTIKIKETDLQMLPDTEYRILFLIANGLLEATAHKHTYETRKVQLTCEGTIFQTSVKTMIDEGWKVFDIALRKLFQLVSEEEENEQNFPALSQGMIFENVKTELSEHFTAPPKHFTEDSLLAAMEKAGTEDMADDVERKGLGTSATRADVIDKLVQDGYAKREKKSLIPTENAIHFIEILPEKVKSAALTAEWENMLALIAKGIKSENVFMQEIESMVIELISSYKEKAEEVKKAFIQPEDKIGICPNCGDVISKGKYGAYCRSKCGMNVSHMMGVVLTDSQVKAALAGKRFLLKGLKSKTGKTYDTYITTNGIQEYQYTNKDGNIIKGMQFKFTMEFPNTRK